MHDQPWSWVSEGSDEAFGRGLWAFPRSNMIRGDRYTNLSDKHHRELACHFSSCMKLSGPQILHDLGCCCVTLHFVWFKHGKAIRRFSSSSIQNLLFPHNAFRLMPYVPNRLDLAELRAWPGEARSCFVPFFATELTSYAHGMKPIMNARKKQHQISSWSQHPDNRSTMLTIPWTEYDGRARSAANVHKEALYVGKFRCFPSARMIERER